MKKTIRDIDVTGKRVLLRADLNAPLGSGRVMDDARIRAVLPTIQYLSDHGARILLLSHLGRPDGFVVENLRMNPVASRLTELLGKPVVKVNNCIGPEVKEAVRTLQPGHVLLLENVRFHPGEVVNDPHFARQLAAFADLYVSDAFASAHRQHASTSGIARFLPSVAGFLLEQELDGLQRARQLIHPPVIALLGGSRLLDRADFIEHCLERPTSPHEHHSPTKGGDIRGARVLLGGVLANTFLRVFGYETGISQVESEALGFARSILQTAGNRLLLPVDVVISDSLSPNASFRTVPAESIPPGGCIVDLGPRTIDLYLRQMEQARTIIWNGPLGVTEIPAFTRATTEIASYITGLENTFTIVGGGDTTAALHGSNLSGQVDYLSTGGAAFLDALQGLALPGISVLEDVDNTKTGVQGSREPGTTRP
jgi:phosphoglycerate kinase